MRLLTRKGWWLVGIACVLVVALGVAFVGSWAAISGTSTEAVPGGFWKDRDGQVFAFICDSASGVDVLEFASTESSPDDWDEPSNLLYRLRATDGRPRPIVALVDDPPGYEVDGPLPTGEVTVVSFAAHDASIGSSAVWDLDLGALPRGSVATPEGVYEFVEWVQRDERCSFLER